MDNYKDIPRLSNDYDRFIEEIGAMQGISAELRKMYKDSIDGFNNWNIEYHELPILIQMMIYRIINQEIPGIPKKYRDFIVDKTIGVLEEPPHTTLIKPEKSFSYND